MRRLEYNALISNSRLNRFEDNRRIFINYNMFNDIYLI